MNRFMDEGPSLMRPPLYRIKTEFSYLSLMKANPSAPIDSDFPMQWQRQWFVLAHQTLSFYRDPAAEEVCVPVISLGPTTSLQEVRGSEVLLVCFRRWWRTGRWTCPPAMTSQSTLLTRTMASRSM